MRKTSIITLITLLFVGINVNAQIGITRDGQLNRCIFGINYKDLIPSIFLYPVLANERLPQYIPNTKSVKIRAYKISYDDFNETSDTSKTSEYEIIIVYDRTGKITKSNLDYPTMWNRDGSAWAFYYDESGRLSSINDGRIKFMYNENGHLYKIKYKHYIYEYDTPRIVEFHFTWGTQSNTPQSVKEYCDGNYDNELVFSVSNNGRTLSCKPNGGKKYVNVGFRSASVTKNTKGQIVDEDIKCLQTCSYDNIYDGCAIHSQDIKYDTNGNLIEQLFYRMTDLGKRYYRGYKYEYEYTFYE